MQHHSVADALCGEELPPSLLAGLYFGTRARAARRPLSDQSVIVGVIVGVIVACWTASTASRAGRRWSHRACRQWIRDGGDVDRRRAGADGQPEPLEVPLFTATRLGRLW